MSYQATRWVLEHSRARPSERLVMLAIAEHADARGRDAYPSRRTIAKATGLSPRQVHRCCQGAKARGELDWEPRAVPRRLPGGQVVKVHRYWFPKMGNTGDTDVTGSHLGRDTEVTSGGTLVTSEPDRGDIPRWGNHPEPPPKTKTEVTESHFEKQRQPEPTLRQQREQEQREWEREAEGSGTDST